MKYLIIFTIFLSDSLLANDVCLTPYSSKISKVQLNKCPKLQSYINNYENSQIYLALATPFLRNPASVFGHNFLLFTKSNPEESVGGLTLNFEAVDDSKSGVDYIYKGLFGKFQGRYNLKKFYNNIKTYNNFEDRDLIFYKLKYSKKEIKQYLLKAWEYFFSPPKIPYYFLNGNCSYYIVDFLKSDKPNHNLPLVYYAPIESPYDLGISFKERPIVNASLKKNIMSYSDRDEKISKLYSDAQYQLYKASRKEDTPKLKPSIQKLNKHKLDTKEELPKIKYQYSPLNSQKYSVISLGLMNANYITTSFSAVNNFYYDSYGANKLELFSYSLNEVDQREAEVKLFELSSIQSFSNKFKDYSWNASVQHQRRDNIDFISTNTQFGFGYGYSYDSAIHAKLVIESIVDSRFIDAYPALYIMMNAYPFELFIKAGKKYRRNYLSGEMTQILSHKHSLSIRYFGEKLQNQEDRVSFQFQYRF